MSKHVKRGRDVPLVAGGTSRRRIRTPRNVAARSKRGGMRDLAFTRFRSYQSCMVYGIQKGGREGVLYWPIVVQ